MPRINDQIKAHQVRVVGLEGQLIGIMVIEKALELAEEKGLDLVEIAPSADPPVCRILDFGKFKYQTQKKKSESRKKQKTIQVKEIKIRPNINSHDYDIKLKSAEKFILEGDKVKMTMRFRGREMAHKELGLGVLERVRDKLSHIAKVDQDPKLDGRQMIMVISPK